ncbi:hypothetical protein [Streptomyces sp. NBC_00306]|uniref:hypothetical protein n=1 Tax=Streptomyces sp. NBC_00306 TaxID=2975708 RepID=UPI002E288E09|nr:hypothetical protein [Streptomyces sp. NBC_00306]
MSTNTTDCLTRDAMMRAFSVAEHVVAGLPFTPRQVTIADRYGDAFEIRLYCHNKPDDVRAFAAHFGVEATANPLRDGSPDTYTEAAHTVNDVAVSAWSITRPDSASS